MAYQLTNQRPAVLDPVHTHQLQGDYDPVPHIRKALVEPVFDPLSGSGTASLVDSKSNAVDADEVLDLVMRCVGDTLDSGAEKAMKDIYGQALVDYDVQDPVRVHEVFTVQAREQNNHPRAPMPAPSARVIYSAQDVIDPAKEVLRGTEDGSRLFAGIAYQYQPQTLGFWFQSEKSFQEFQNFVSSQAQGLSSVLPGKTNQLLNQFTSSLKLKGLTESLILRNAEDQENEEYSFARTIINFLMQWQSTKGAAAVASNQLSTAETGVLPFTVNELFLPKTVVLVNVEAHAKASGKKIDREWKMITASLQSPVKVVSNQKLSKLTALSRNRAKAAAAAANAQSNRSAPAGRMAKVVFRSAAPKPVHIINGVLRVMKKMKDVSRSQNTYKRVSTTYSRANRRDPMDPNRPGKSVVVRYLPDLHIYLDCSGSIDEDNYRDGIINLIHLAKKLNINIYFNSFSHIMSQETLLKTANKSVTQIWEEFRRITKVQGGTDFEQIWRYVNISKARRSRLSLVVTDFGWTSTTQRSEHPANLYYAPIAHNDWNTLKYLAKQFSDSMTHIEPAIHQKMIGMTV